LAAQLTTFPSGEGAAFLEQYNAIGDLSQYLPVGLWLLVVLCVGWALWRRDRAVGRD
jgi:hypothetical protein